MIFPAGAAANSRGLSVIRGQTSRGNVPGPRLNHSVLASFSIGPPQVNQLPQVL